MIAGRWLTEIAKPFLASQNRVRRLDGPALAIMGRLGIGDIEQFAGARQNRVSGKRVGEVRKFGRTCLRACCSWPARCRRPSLSLLVGRAANPV